MPLRRKGLVSSMTSWWWQLKQHLPALSVLPRPSRFTSVHQYNTGENLGNGSLPAVSVSLLDAGFPKLFSASLNYFRAPTFDFGRTMPGFPLQGKRALVGVCPLADCLRVITVYGTNFKADSGGMHLRVTAINANTSSSSLLQVLVHVYAPFTY